MIFNLDLRSDFDERVDAYIIANLEAEECDKWIDVIKLEFGGQDNFCNESFLNAIDKMMERRDGIDFDLAAFSWLMNKYWSYPILNMEFKERVIEGFVQLPWWLNETGELNDVQYWSENHQIGWKAGRYLIGQALSKDPELQNLIFEASGLDVFTFTEIGKQSVKQWLDYRARLVLKKSFFFSYDKVYLRSTDLAFLNSIRIRMVQ